MRPSHNVLWFVELHLSINLQEVLEDPVSRALVLAQMQRCGGP
jgi:hypothetical protein